MVRSVVDKLENTTHYELRTTHTLIMEEEVNNEVPSQENEVNSQTSDAPADQTQEGTSQVSEVDKKKKPQKEPERQDMTTLHERTIAAMSYFGPLAIVPFYLKKDSEFCRFHGKQGMILAIIFFMAQLFTVIDLVMDLFLILQVSIVFYMGLPALSGRWKKMPFVYDWSCQLEESLSLKTKEEELEEVKLKPEELSKREEQVKN